MRSKVSRLEEDNESMVLQLKKMATKTSINYSITYYNFFKRKIKLKFINLFIDYRQTNITDRDEGISDVEDATELKLLLELSEQVTY